MAREGGKEEEADEKNRGKGITEDAEWRGETRLGAVEAGRKGEYEKGEWRVETEAVLQKHSANTEK